MSNLFWLTDAQMERLKPFFPKSHGKPRVPRPAGHCVAMSREGRQTRSQRDNLHQSQWVAVVRCAQGIRSAQDLIQPLEALERHGCVRPDHGWPSL